MKSKTKIFIVHIISIVIAFLFWLTLQKVEYQAKIEEVKQEKHYVKIEELKTKVKFEALWENVFIILWDDLIKKWEIKKK